MSASLITCSLHSCIGLGAQVDIPHAARSALDVLRAQRLQKHSAHPTAASSPMLSSPPLHDTLAPSEPPSNPSQAKERSKLSPIRDTQPSGLDMPPVNSTLPSSTLQGPSSGASESQPDMAPLDDTALDGSATDMQSDEHAPQVGKEKGGNTSSALLYDTLHPGMTLGQAGSRHEEDEMLIRQAVSDESAGAGHASPTPGQNDDDEALLHSLLEEEETAQLTSC